MKDYLSMIRAYMSANRKTQEQMAALLNVKRTTLTQWLNNKRNMNLEGYFKCAEFFERGTNNG